MSLSGDLFGTARWSNAELAEVFGISAQRLGVLCKQGVVPLPQDGLHDPKIAVAAYVRHLKKKDEGSSKAGEEVKKIQLENEMRQIRLQKIAGELVPVDRVQKDWFESTRRVRDGMLNLPARLSGVFAAESNQEKIFESFTKEVHAVLTELSSRQFGQIVTESLPLEDTEAQMNEQAFQNVTRELRDEQMDEYNREHQQEEKCPDVLVVDNRSEQGCEPDRFSTGD